MLAFILIFVLLFIGIMFFQGSKGVVYMASLNKILKNEYGWTQSEIDNVWNIHTKELNNLKLDGKSTSDIAKYIEQHFQHYKSAFK